MQKIKSKRIKNFKNKFYKIPNYSKKLIFNEANLFLDWYVPQVINKSKILGRDAEYNANAFMQMIEGTNNSFQKIVELNAGAALYLSGKAKNLKDGFELAKQVIISKKSKKYIENLIKKQ